MSQGPVAGRYVLSHRLGQGGMGVVWRARDGLLEREVAIKEVRLPAAESDPAYQRTMREARAAARLRHPGIVTVYDVVLHEDRPWIVMELLDGPSLAQLLDRDGPLPPHRVAAIALQLVEALETAHRKGILHRDVKPANVLLDGARAVLTDFGIATMQDATALTASGLLVGSPEYTAPERIDGATAGTPADLWALGVTLYTAAAGRSPFRREGTAATLAAVVASDPDPLPGAGALWPAITGLLHKDPARRLTTGQARPLLERAAAAVPDPAPATRPPYPVPTLVENPRAMVTASPDTLPRTRTAPPGLPTSQGPQPVQGFRQPVPPPHRYPARSPGLPMGPILTVAGALVLATVVVIVWSFWPERPSRAGTGSSTTTTSTEPTGTTTEPDPTTSTTTEARTGPPVTPAPAPPDYVSRQEPHLAYSVVLPMNHWVDLGQSSGLVMTYQFVPAGYPEVFCRVSVSKLDESSSAIEFLKDEFEPSLADEIGDGYRRLRLEELSTPGPWATGAAEVEYTGKDSSKRAPFLHGMARSLTHEAGQVYTVQIRIHESSFTRADAAWARDRPAIAGMFDSLRIHL